ncbi:MAG TPA: hypothetical protein VHR45_25850 [Thermoanaerobaculia bacterium]|nr:hypothetical protein [Thermoanaerobaculia bacterium]
MSGDLVALFNRYLADLEKNKIRVDLDRMRIIFFLGPDKTTQLEGGNQVKMDLGKLFAGMTMRQVWAAKLKGFKEARDVEEAEAEAAVLGADLICGARE